MFRVALVSTLLAVAACPPTDGVKPCTGNADCSLRAGGVCLASPLGTDQCAYPNPACASGLSWGELSTDIAGQCVTAIDAGVDAIDASTVDAIDAPLDGSPSGPVVATHQAADLVLGQADLTTATLSLPYTAASISARSPAIDNGVLWVADSARARVLAWVPQPTANNANAARVVGRSSFTSDIMTGMPSASNLSAGVDVAAAAGRLVVADTGWNRVLLWDQAPLASNVSPNRVLGQTNFTSSSFGSGPSQMHIPSGVWTDGARIAVAEPLNARVLIWTTWPTVNGQPANIILGNGPTAPASASSIRPSSVHFDGQRFYVVDRAWNRILVWNSFPTASGQAADFVIGQPDFTTVSAGRSASAFNQPASVTTTSDALFVADFTNDRVLVFTPIPTATGATATFVLGQPDLNTGENNPAPTAQSIDGPLGLAVGPDGLWVADRNHNRALRFRLYQ